MAIARRFSSYTIASFKLRVPLRKARGQQPLALGFRAHLQQSLPERHIDRQLRCDMIGEGDASLGFKARRVFFVKDAMALVEELLELRGNGGVDAGEIFFEIYDFGFKIGFLFVGADQTESALPGRKDVGAAILILLQGLDNERGASGLRDVSVMVEHDAERGLCFDAMARHHTVARLEDVQRNRLAGKENDAQRKKRNECRAHGRVAAMITEGRARIRMCLRGTGKISATPSPGTACCKASRRRPLRPEGRSSRHRGWSNDLRRARGRTRARD